MKYTTEEVRARINKAWQNHDEQGRVFITMGDAMALVETILPERIEASEGSVPDSMIVLLNHIEGLMDSGILPEGSIPTDMWNAVSMHNFAHPPAQAAQVDPAAKPNTLADFVHAPDAERARTGQQVASMVDKMMAEPVAQTAQVDWIAALRKELLHSKMTHNFTFTRDEVMQLIGDPFSQPRAVPDGAVEVLRKAVASDGNAVSIVFDSQEAADRFHTRMDEAMKVRQNTAKPVVHDEAVAKSEACKVCGKDTPHHHLRGTAPTPTSPINLAAVREVIESHINEAKNLRHDPESQNYLYEQADKLEAALQEKGK